MAIASIPLSISQNEDRTATSDRGPYVIGFASGTVSNPTGPYSFTGYSAEMQVRQSQDSASALYLTLNTGGGGLTLGGPTTLAGIPCGTIIVSITAAQSAALPAGPLYYDIKLTNSSGAQTYYLSGAFVVTATGSR